MARIEEGAGRSIDKTEAKSSAHLNSVDLLSTVKNSEGSYAKTENTKAEAKLPGLSINKDKSESPEEKLDRLRRERDELMQKKIHENMDKTGKQISETVNHTGKHITESVNGAGKQVTQALDGLRKQISDTADGAGKQISHTIEGAGHWVVQTKENVGNAVKQSGIDEVKEANQQVAKEREKLVKDDQKQAQEAWDQAIKGVNKSVSKTLDAVAHSIKI